MPVQTTTHIQTFTAIFETHLDKINNHLRHSDWLKEWDTEFAASATDEDRRFEQLAFTPEEQKSFLAFALPRLLACDPTSDKRYAPYLFRWFRFGLQSHQLYIAKDVLEKYDAAQQGAPYKLEPWALIPDKTNIKISHQNKPARSNPLLAYKHVPSLSAWLYGQDEKRIFAADIGAIKARDAKFIGNGATIHADTPVFRLYSAHTKKAHEAYCADSRRSEYDNNSLYLELADGGRYRINKYGVHGIHIYDQFGHYVNFERMLRAIPDLPQALAEQFVPYAKSKRFKNRKGETQRILWNFACVASGWDGASLLPDGEMARLFETRYRSGLKEFIEIRKAAETDLEQTPWYELGRKLREQTRALHYLCSDLAVLARHPNDRKKINPAFIAELVATASHGCDAMAQRALAIVETVPEWRQALNADGLAPLFTNLTAQEKEKSTTQSLVFLFARVAQNPAWRDGSEAVYLPKAINHILATRNWAKLKTILTCATHPSDPVSAAWRAAIPRDLRMQINAFRFDNSFRYHYIDRLMLRMEMLDAGDTRMMRLRDMPHTSSDMMHARQASAQIRAQRQRKSGIVAHA